LKIWKKLVAMPVLIAVLVCVVGSSVLTVQAAEADRRGKDYSGLEKQIGIANGLEYYDYTKETWDVLKSAVEAGNKLLAGAAEQGRLDEAAEDIEHAIENLVKMDYSPLINVLDTVYAKMDENPQLHDVWYRLDKAVDKARPLLVSGDQQAVDEMAEVLAGLMEELSAYDEVTAEPEVIIQEVEVEVPPAADFCNIPVHRIWPVLFVVSVVLNLLLLAALGYILLQKRNSIDNTPLVYYDMDDDPDDFSDDDPDEDLDENTEDGIDF